MANTFGSNPIILDTQNTDGTYSSTNDAVVAGGTKYSTGKYKIRNILATGANGQVVKLNQCSSGDLDTGNIINVTLETGDLNKVIPMDGYIANGICPETITSGAKVYIYLY